MYEKGGAKSLEEFWSSADYDTRAPELNQLIGEIVKLLFRERGENGTTS